MASASQVVAERQRSVAAPAALAEHPGSLAGPMRFGLVRLLRPRHWAKNVFVFAPVVFAGLVLDGSAMLHAGLAALLFSAAASSVYVINDLVDVERDRRHPTKSRTRPIAAGAVTRSEAALLLGVLLVLLIAGGLLWPMVGGVVGLYLAVNLAYSLKLKHVPVVDLFCLASGFVLRVWAGALAVAVPLSSWMMVTTLCLALYLAAIKRRQELVASGTEGRLVLASYSQALLERYAEMAAVGSIVFYGLYVVEVRPELAITIPLVLFGLYRYWFLVEQGMGENPTDVLYRDVLLLCTVVFWGALSAALVTLG